MEKYNNGLDKFPSVNPDWERAEVRSLITKHSKESVESGIQENFKHSMLQSIEKLKDHIGINQIDDSEFLAYSDAPIVVLTDYDEVNDLLFVSLAKIDVLTGWLKSVAEKYHVDTSLVHVATVLHDGSIQISDCFTQEQHEIIQRQKAEYSGLGFNFSRAKSRHIENHSRLY